jgi:hypothetical protein
MPDALVGVLVVVGITTSIWLYAAASSLNGIERELKNVWWTNGPGSERARQQASQAALLAESVSRACEALERIAEALEPPTLGRPTGRRNH